MDFVVIPFGAYNVEIASSRPKNLACHRCGQKGEVEITKYSRLGYLIYIPFFPYRLFTQFRCVACESDLQFQEMDEALKAHYGSFKLRKLPKFWHFSGLLLVLLLYLVSHYKDYRAHQTIEERLAKLEVERVITYEIDDGLFSSYKVIGLEKGRIQVFANKLQVTSLNQMHLIEGNEYYQKDTLDFSSQYFQDLLNSEKIKAITW